MKKRIILFFAIAMACTSVKAQYFLANKHEGWSCTLDAGVLLYDDFLYSNTMPYSTSLIFHVTKPYSRRFAGSFGFGLTWMQYRHDENIGVFYYNGDIYGYYWLTSHQRLHLETSFTIRYYLSTKFELSLSVGLWDRLWGNNYYKEDRYYDFVVIYNFSDGIKSPFLVTGESLGCGIKWYCLKNFFISFSSQLRYSNIRLMQEYTNIIPTNYYYDSDYSDELFDSDELFRNDGDNIWSFVISLGIGVQF